MVVLPLAECLKRAGICATRMFMSSSHGCSAPVPCPQYACIVHYPGELGRFSYNSPWGRCKVAARLWMDHKTGQGEKAGQDIGRERRMYLYHASPAPGFYKPICIEMLQDIVGYLSVRKHGLIPKSETL